MALKEYRLGSIGPFEYDDAEFAAGFSTTGIIRAEQAPAGANDVLRLGDVGAGVAPHDAEYVVMSLNANLTAERRLQVGNSLSLVDGGANGDVTLDAIQDIRTTAVPEFAGLGIGTDEPGQEVEIYSSSPGLRIRDSGATANACTAVIEFGGTDAAVWARTGYVGDAAGGNASIYLDAEVADLILHAADDIYLNPGGTGVGIAEATPGARLHVQGAASGITGIFRAHATTPGNIMEWQSSIGGILGSVDSGGNIYGQNFQIPAGGYMGISGGVEWLFEAAGRATLAGAVATATLTWTAAGPTDNIDVSGVNTLFVNPAGNAITIGGLAGGVDGQTIDIVIISTNNSVTLEHNEGGATQPILLHKGLDETLAGEYGGWNLKCHGGVDWHDISHAKHV